MSWSTKAGLAIILLHVVGTLGMLLPALRPWMLNLTPVNLLIVAALVFFFQKKKSTSFYSFAVFCFVVAFMTEVVGVHSGWPFGTYEYGKTLGPQWMGVPLLIGSNWLVLVLCSASLARHISNPWLAALAGALLMLLMDILLEPVAISSDYWTWEGGKIPFQNYLSWACLAFLLHIALQKFHVEKQNDIDIYVLGSQAAFFLLLHLLG